MFFTLFAYAKIFVYMGLFSKKNPNAVTPAATISSGNIKQVNEQKSAKNALNEQVLQYIHEGIVIIGTDKNIQLVNPAAEHMIGKSRDEIIGLEFGSSIKLLDNAGQPVADDKNPILFALSSGKTGETRDYKLQTLDSQKITPVSIIVTPTNGTGSNLVVTFRDITQQLKEEEERNDFISTASHEMRTPVASIEGYLGLAMNPATATVDSRAMEYLQKAHEASQHLGHLFQDLLDTTKMDDQLAKLHMVPVELVATTRSIVEGQIPNIQKKGLGFRFSSGNPNANFGGGKKLGQLVYTSLDIDSYREIIDNLLENAIKYTPSGWITVTVGADMDNVHVSVQDTGIGMPREELTHVFQKFYRIDNSDTREIGGTGLGLYLVKKRTEAMSGHIDVTSEVGKGSTFTVSFPRMSDEVYKQQRFVMDNLAEQAKNKLLEN